MHGLKPIIQKDLAIPDFTNHAEASDKALKVEMAHEKLEQYLKQEEKKRSNDHEDRTDSSRRQKVNEQNGKMNQKKEEHCPRCGGDHQIDKCSQDRGVCFRCKKPGHKLKDCLVAMGACFHCKKIGHKIADCPERTA